MFKQHRARGPLAGTCAVRLLAVLRRIPANKDGACGERSAIPSQIGAQRSGSDLNQACACTAVRAAVFTMSCTLQPRLRSLQGLARPWSTA